MIKLSGSKDSWLLLGATTYLVAIGLLIQFSIHGPQTTSQSKPFTQVLAVGLGVVIASLAAVVPMGWWRRIAPIGLILTVLLLLVVGRYGPLVFGARRWLLLGSFQLQPSELLKPILISVNSGLLAKLAVKYHWRSVGELLVVVAVPVLLLLNQPDLSTAIILIMLWLAQLLVSPAKRQVIGGLMGAFVIASFLAMPLLNTYQHGRIQTFLKDRHQESAANYNVVQARVAMGSGGLTGRGLTGGSQSQLSFLPSQQTDFVFAVVAEKLGFIGAVSVLAAELLVVVAAWRISSRVNSVYLSLLGFGIVVVFSVQSLVNMAMNVGLAPVAGLPLPFVSYGGTSMVVSLLMIGWLINIDLKRPFTY